MFVFFQGVTALACTSDSRRVVSGGGEGQVRIWDVTPKGHVMKEALKEHKGAVTCIKIRRNDEEVKIEKTLLYITVQSIDLAFTSANTVHSSHPSSFSVIRQARSTDYVEYRV